MNKKEETFNLPKGSLAYLGYSDTIKLLDFKTLKTKKIYTLPDQGYIEHMSFVDSRTLLFEAYFFKDEPNTFIMKLDLNTLKADIVCEGYGSMYMPKYKSFFFFDSKKDIGPHLYFASLLKPSENIKK